MTVGGRDQRLKLGREHGFEIVELQATTPEELEKAFREAARQTADAVTPGPRRPACAPSESSQIAASMQTRSTRPRLMKPPQSTSERATTRTLLPAGEHHGALRYA
jgi:hypothetical protein